MIIQSDLKDQEENFKKRLNDRKKKKGKKLEKQ